MKFTQYLEKYAVPILGAIGFIFVIYLKSFLVTKEEFGEYKEGVKIEAEKSNLENRVEHIEHTIDDIENDVEDISERQKTYTKRYWEFYGNANKWIDANEDDLIEIKTILKYTNHGK